MRIMTPEQLKIFEHCAVEVNSKPTHSQLSPASEEQTAHSLFCAILEALVKNDKISRN